MIKKGLLLFLVLGLSYRYGMTQSFVSTSDLFQRSEDNYHNGQLNIFQDSAIDSLLSRYIFANTILAKENLHNGMAGFRIQIYNSSNRNAREESNKVNAEFISKFPDIRSYIIPAKPAYFRIRVGDFRTKTEATRLFVIISRDFPNAYIVPDFINFPDLNIK